MNEQQQQPSALSELMGNKNSRKNVTREWYKAIPSEGGLERLVCRIMKMNPETKLFDTASIRFFNADTSPGFFYIKAMDATKLSIDLGVEMYNAECERAIRGEPLDATLYHLPDMKRVSCTTYTNLIALDAETIEDDNMVRYRVRLLSPAFGTKYLFTGPKGLTKDLAARRFNSLFWAMYPGCDLKDPNSVVQASPEDIREAMNELPPLE